MVETEIRKIDLQKNRKEDVQRMQQRLVDMVAEIRTVFGLQVRFTQEGGVLLPLDYGSWRGSKRPKDSVEDLPRERAEKIAEAYSAQLKMLVKNGAKIPRDYVRSEENRNFIRFYEV